MTARTESPDMLKFIKNNFVFILILVGVMGFRTAVADWNPVPSSSMEPTIFPGDVVLVNKTILGPSIPFTESRLLSYREPQRGDIITFKAPDANETYIKRVIGLPGDRIRTAGTNVFLNGAKLPLRVIDDGSVSGTWVAMETIGGHEHQIKLAVNRGMRQVDQEITVPEKSYFVMGDYRNNSEDSRYFGFVPQHSIIGRATRIAVSIASERHTLSSIGSVLN